MPSAYLQWQFHSSERVVARGPLVLFSYGISRLSHDEDLIASMVMYVRFF